MSSKTNPGEAKRSPKHRTPSPLNKTPGAQARNYVQTEPPTDPERRKFMVSVCTLIASCAAAVEALPPAIKDGRELLKEWTVDKRVSSLPEVASARFSDEERTGRMRELLFPTDRIADMVPARNHPDFRVPEGRSTYPNEEFAENAILRLFPGVANEIVEDPYEVEPGHSTILLGSSVSNQATRLVMGEVDNPKFSHRGSGFLAELQYSVKSLADQKVTRLQDNNPEWTVASKVIVDRNRNYVAIPEYDAHKKLRTDFLLVSRIPRELGCSNQLIFSPTHGPGMRAVEKLLFEIRSEDFEHLLHAVEGEEYFQAIFEVGDLYEQGGTTHPGSLRLVRKASGCPRVVRIKSARGTSLLPASDRKFRGFQK